MVAARSRTAAAISEAAALRWPGAVASTRPARPVLDHAAQRRFRRTLCGRHVRLARICGGIRRGRNRRGTGRRRERRCRGSGTGHCRAKIRCSRLVRDGGGRRGGRGRNRQRVGGRWIGIVVHRETELSRKRRTTYRYTLAFNARSVYHAQRSKGRDPSQGLASSLSAAGR